MRKIRLTGGEPLLRRNLERLVEMLAAHRRRRPHADDQRRAARAQRPARCATPDLKRVTVSLDALDDPTFRAMNDVDFPVARVLEGIDAAAAAGLAPHQDQRGGQARRERARDRAARAAFPAAAAHIVRFIEYMDVGHTNGWRMDDVVPAAEIVERIDRELPLEPVDPNYAGEVAQRWRYATAAARSASSRR